MRVLVFGAEGMLGHKVVRALDGVVGTVRGGTAHPILADLPYMTRVDVHNWWSILQALDSAQPEAVVNCIGMVKQRQAEAADAIAVNALFPHQLAALCRGRGIRLIHISTDCVFDGKRGGYTEADPSDAVDIYGRSKALGELHDNALTLRTSMIGRELTGLGSLLEWFLAQDTPVAGYTRAFFSGVTTNWLAATIRTLLSDHPRLNGLYNVASQRISKHDLLTLAADAYRKPRPNPEDRFTVDRSLDGSAFTVTTGIHTPSWESMMAGMAADVTPYEEWR